MNGDREVLEGVIDGHAWRASWTYPRSRPTPSAPGVWRFIVDGRPVPLRVAEPHPRTAGCEAVVEDVVRTWLAHRGD